MSNKYYTNVEASLLKYCNDFINKNNLSTFQPFNFDEHASINSVPDEDLIGIAELAMVNNQGTYDVTCQFIVCTKSDDTAIARLRKAVSYLFDELRPGSTSIKIVTFDQGQIVGNLTVENGVSVLPVARTKGRPLQPIAVMFGSSLISPP